MSTDGNLHSVTSRTNPRGRSTVRSFYENVYVASLRPGLKLRSPQLQILRKHNVVISDKVVVYRQEVTEEATYRPEEETLGWNGGCGVDINMERERSFGSYAGIDDFIGALPVKQMYKVYAELCAGKQDHLHEYIMMLRWLRSSMEISEVYLEYTRTKLEEHYKCYKKMKADEAVDDEVIYLHKKDGFHKKRGYSIFVYLSMAMTVVNVLAKQIDKYEWQQCQCTKCAYYRSPEWRQTRPDDITPAMLPPMRFYRRGSKGVSPSEKIYRKQRGQKL
ncbi:uncharacterized protein PITG_16564 [Phytophthora infestans T30-4]|uniref:Uncharacterized protein n=1 Tax=Phytophthora infestans (strain T30-4) TaxID=403677 RepID=D0NUQ6_PHYIT|nr:uncharacterized protein PITG_16564 [Phytophthora infestans T30-4]EEY65417.1 conserved hypothetical protein [Phytophthora infestans T30-4]|eukprot:XP_002897135.1 conserved hypothetical protein [Phytophthora infestans T30-4]